MCFFGYKVIKSKSDFLLFHSISKIGSEVLFAFHSLALGCQVWAAYETNVVENKSEGDGDDFYPWWMAALNPHTFLSIGFAAHLADLI